MNIPEKNGIDNYYINFILTAKHVNFVRAANIKLAL